MSTVSPIEAGKGERINAIEKLPTGTLSVLQAQTTVDGYALFLEQEDQIIIITIRTAQILAQLLGSTHIEIQVSGKSITIKPSADGLPLHEVILPLSFILTIYPGEPGKGIFAPLEPNTRYPIKYAFERRCDQLAIIEVREGETAIVKVPPQTEIGLYTLHSVAAYPDDFDFILADNSESHPRIVRRK